MREALDSALGRRPTWMPETDDENDTPASNEGTRPKSKEEGGRGMDDQNMIAEPDPVTTAINALTEAARRRRTIGAGTPNEHSEPVDFGEIACHVITAVAANVGSVEALLAGRPGSWEADYVRRIVLSAAGDNERQLLRYRSEPLRLVVDVDGELGDMGIYDLVEEAGEQLNQRVEEAMVALIEGVATPAERARLADIEAVFAEWGTVIQGDARRARAAHLRDEHAAIFDDITSRAEKAGDPLHVAFAAAVAADHRLTALWEQDQQQYREAYGAAVRQHLDELAIPVGVEVVDTLSDQADAALGEYERLSVEVAEFVDELHAHAQKAAVLPMSGEAPDWSDGTPADALRRAGLTYLERATAS